jgi:hypothetical protein
MGIAAAWSDAPSGDIGGGRRLEVIFADSVVDAPWLTCLSAIALI